MSDATRSYTAADITSPGEAAADATESVGTALRKAREKRGLSLPQASRDLCLKEDVLRALESRQYSALPKVPYCFGFVRTYARHLGLEPEEMVRRFKGEIGDVPQPTKLKPPQPIRSGRFPGRAAITFSVLVAAAAYGAWHFYMAKPAEISVPATSADANSPMAPVPLVADDVKKRGETDTAAKEPNETPDPGKTGATTSAPPAPAKGKVVIRATGACWVYIHDQKGKVVFHKTMRKGDEYAVPEQKSDLVMELGNPAALQITVDGRALKPIAGAGQARRVSLDPKELAKLP
ncbi:MAG TPA: RodZ domain-containing protein [Alphaproteobacteria bacterium]|jgi:cytoskeleton protein RodZ